jgi:solute carrier family 25 folate transporter 32
MAGAGSTLLLHPLDLIKVRFQLDSSKGAKPVFHTFRELIRIGQAYRLSGLYQGFSANWSAGMAAWGLYFYLYDHFKDWSRREITSGSAAFFLASGMAGSATMVIVNPLFVAKTRMCSQPFDQPKMYKTLPGTLKTIVQQEGVTGLYRGLLPGLFGVSHGAVQFTFYENLKLLSRRYGFSDSNLTYILSSSASKILAAVTTYPYQVVRSRVQLPLVYGTSVSGVIVDTWKREGFRGFYRGLVPSTFRVLPGTALTFLIYENTIKYLN